MSIFDAYAPLMSASSSYGSLPPAGAVDGTTSTYWLSGGVVAAWLKADLGVGNTALGGSYTLQMNIIPEPNRAPQDWTFQGSVNDSDWTTIDTVTGEVSWGSGEEREFICDSPSETPFRYFKIDITDNNGDASYTQIAEIDVFIPAYTTEKVLTEGVGLSDTIEPDLFVVVLTEAVALNSFSGSEEFYSLLTEAVGLNDTIDRDFYFYRIFTEGAEFSDVVTPDLFVVELVEILGLNDIVGRDFYFYRTSTEGVELTDAVASFNWTQWLAQNEYRAIKKYYLTLTGAADSTTDVVLPMKSFQGTLRDGDPTYLSCVIPGVEYASQINARSNGDFIVEMAYLLDGVEQYKEQLAIVDLETIRIDEGAKNKSITLSGHRTESFASKNVILDGASYYNISGGEYQYRLAKVDMYLKPGDTVEVNGDSFTVDYVSYFVSVSRQQMDISE